jgi:2-oxo-4-hydroxy-4-carboxy-5-ureidoimidazoline decarboxylase
VTITLDDLNSCGQAAFVGAVGDIFEHGPWVAERAYAARPFATVAALHEAMMQAVRAAPRAERLAFLRGHPELGGKVARAGAMTEESKAEQGGLGLDRLSDAEFERFERLNTAYREKFGFPFIIGVRRHTRDSILAGFERRGMHDIETELAAALGEIGFITRLRLVAKVDGPGKPKTGGILSTHVLDTVRGRPASAMRIDLFEVGASARSMLTSTRTNADGRTDRPLIADGPLRIGTYELQFHAGAYFAANNTPASDPAYLDIVPIRFSVAEPESHYHVPLIVTPWSYTTYRGG